MANPPSSPSFDWKMYRYIPSLAGAIAALIIFLILTLLHLWQYLRSRKLIAFLVISGALCTSFCCTPSTPISNTIPGEVGGFGARIASHFDNAAWGPFISQGVLLLVGPLFYAATIYMLLGRTIRLAGGEDVSLIQPKWYTRIFVTADVTTLLVQGFGTYWMKDL
jgi:hypothetical protein